MVNHRNSRLRRDRSSALFCDIVFIYFNFKLLITNKSRKKEAVNIIYGKFRKILILKISNWIRN